MDIYESLAYISEKAFPKIKQDWTTYTINNDNTFFMVVDWIHPLGDYVSDNYRQGLNALLQVIESGELQPNEMTTAEKLLIALATNFVNLHSDLPQNKQEIAYSLYANNPVFRAATDMYAVHASKLISNIITYAYFKLDQGTIEAICNNSITNTRSPVKALADVTIEIQVASVLMHAWSEVEHDLAYKKKMGNVSREEYECLDEINGLVMAGEIALRRLNQLSQQRIRNASTLETHYTLAMYITDWKKGLNLKGLPLGNVEALYKIYKAANCLTYGDVDRQLEILNKQGIRKNEPLADQLIDIFSGAKHRKMVKSILSKAIIDSNGVETTSTLNTKIGVFLGKWNALEDRINKALRKLGFSRITRIEFVFPYSFILAEGTAYFRDFLTYLSFICNTS